MQWNGKTVYVDPVGGGKRFADLPKPDLVLVTHIHADHFDPATLEAVIPAGGKTIVVAPKTVAEKIPESLRGKTMVRILTNGEKTEALGIAVEAVPAYNMTPGKEKFHPKGRDNGYVLTLGGKKVYIAADTEDTPEMRVIKGIDIAFLPMNLPYTMSVEKAAMRSGSSSPRSSTPTTTAAMTARRRTSGNSRNSWARTAGSRSGCGSGILQNGRGRDCRCRSP